MNVLIVTDYDNIRSTNMTLSNCTNNENNIEIIIRLITIIQCGMSLICLISLMVYTLFNKKKILTIICVSKWKSFVTQIIHFDVS